MKIPKYKKKQTNDHYVSMECKYKDKVLFFNNYNTDPFINVHPCV